MSGYRFLPAGRIIAGAGTDRKVTLFNCFVMGTIEDDMGAIFNGLREAALTMQQGGGIGHDFSTLRPRGAAGQGSWRGCVRAIELHGCVGRHVPHHHVGGFRRGAMMATMRCDHPDIEDFIAAKHEAQRLRMFNLSVLVTDPFMAAVKADGDWPLVFGGHGIQAPCRHASCGTGSCGQPMPMPSPA